MTTAAFTIHPTPVGDALLVRTDDGLVALSVVQGPAEGELERLALALRIAPVRDDDAGGAAGVVVEQLDEYFGGTRHDFEVTLDWRLVRGFTRAALEAVQTIPYGETASYGDVAVLAGVPRAARAVGTACAMSPFSIIVPVHRVVRADGSTGGYGRHPEIKRALQSLERHTLERQGLEQQGLRSLDAGRPQAADG